jgi:hypothetical protein
VDVAKGAVTPLIGGEMVTRRVLMRARDVVFFKGVIDAHEGVAQVFAEKGGELTIAAPRCQVSALDALLSDLQSEIAGMHVLSDE